MGIQKELTRQGYVRAVKTRIRKRRKRELLHYETSTFDDTYIYVGKDNLQNDYVTRRLGKKSDMWLHIRDVHETHMATAYEQPDEELLRNAAMLTTWYSNVRYSSNVPVNCCAIRQLKEIPGNEDNFVFLSSYKTIYIDPEPAQIQKPIGEHLTIQEEH